MILVTHGSPRLHVPVHELTVGTQLTQHSQAPLH